MDLQERLVIKMSFKSLTSIDDTGIGLSNRDRNIPTSGNRTASNTTITTPTKSTGTVVDNNPITDTESANKQLAYQKIERDKLIKDIDNNTHTSTPIYQIQKSSGLRTDLFEKLHLINNGIYLLSLYVDDYAKLNIKDAGLLKETLKERIMANLGD